MTNMSSGHFLGGWRSGRFSSGIAVWARVKMSWISDMGFSWLRRFFRYDFLLRVRIQFLQRFRQHPLSDKACLECTQNSLSRIRSVFEVDTGVAEEDMKLIVMVLAEWHPEPCHVVLPAYMVALHTHTSAANYAAQAARLLSRSH